MTEKLQNPFKINELITAVNSLIDGEGSSTPDNLSITQNSSSNLQAVGIINQNATTTAIKTWTGTKAQYDAIVTKDNNTLYNITDDTNVSLTILEALYPIGAIYIGTMEVCPLTVLGVGTWVKVSEGRVLQGSDSGHNAGSMIEPGLPNITGQVKYGNSGDIGVNTSYISGAFYADTGTNVKSASSGSQTNNHPLMFAASRSSSIYGRSSTVQPSAFVVNIWQRTA